MRHFRMKPSIYIWLFFLFLANSCKYKSSKITKNSDNFKHTYSNYNIDSIEFDKKFITEFKDSMKSDISVPNNFDDSLVDKLYPLPLKSNADQYEILADLIKKLPRPYYDTEYYKNYKVVLSYLDNLYKSTAKPVPKILHFIWLGGTLGKAQKEYTEIWTKLNPDYEIQIWYDPENLFTYETQRNLKEHVAVKFLQYRNSSNYEAIYSKNVIELQDQLFNYMKKEIEKNPAAKKDLIRAEFLDKILFNKPQDKIAEKQYYENVKVMNQDIELLEQQYSNLKFKNIRTEPSDWKMKNVYEHELDLRSNFAAASDILRLYIEGKYGGIYSDIDLLPTMIPIYELLDKNTKLRNYLELPLPKDLELSSIIHSFFNEIVLNNKDLIPSYKVTNNNSLQSLKYKLNNILHYSKLGNDFKEAIKNLPDEIVNIAKDEKFKDINNLFFKLGDVYVREGEFKIIRGNNSFIMSHPIEKQSDWLQNLIDTIHDNYAQVLSLEINNPGLKLPYKQTGNISEGIVKYYRVDGLESNMDSTISISGPYAYNNVLDKIGKVTPAGEILYLNNILNSYTPEASVSSWFKRFNDSDKSRKTFVLQLGNEQNTKIAAENIYNKLKKNADLFIVENDKFEKKVFQPLPEPDSDEDSEDERENLIRNERELNKNVKNRLDIHLVGHSNYANDNLQIGGISSENMAKKIKDHLFQVADPKRLDYISIVSCNSTETPTDTKQMELYAKNLLNSLNKLDIPVQIIGIRTTNVRVDAKGDKYYLHENTYTGHREGDKLYLLRKNNDDFVTIKAKYISNELEKNYFSDLKNAIENDNLKIKEIIEHGASGPLGELTEILTMQQNIYYGRTIAEKLAKNLKDVTDSLRKEYSLSEKFVPLLSTLDSQSKFISFIDMESGEVKKNIELNLDQEEKYKNVWEKISAEMKSMKSIPIRTNADGELRNLVESDGLGITPLIIAQTLYGLFKSNNVNSEKNILYDPALSKLLKAQNYLLYSQISYDVFNKAVQVEELISALVKANVINTEESVMPKMSQVINKLMAARYITPGFSFAAMVLDAFEISHAKDSQKGIFATQFSFDTINAGMTLGSLALGEGVASSVLGYLGTPFAGLAIGFTGFAGAAIEAQEESLQIAKFFNEYLKDHNRYGKLSDCSKDSNIVSFAHSSYSKSSTNNCTANLSSAVIKKLDFSSAKKVKVTYGSHYLHKTKNWHKGIFNSYYSNFQGSSKFPSADAENTFSVRESLGLNSLVSYSIASETAIVLPFLMEKDISYGYSYTPGIMTRNDSDLSAVDNLVKDNNSQFVFRYFVDLFEYSIRSLHFEAKDSKIDVILGNTNKTLIVPLIPNEYKNKVTYNIEGGNAKYTLEVGKNALYKIKIKENDEWIFDLSLYNLPLKFIQSGVFEIDSATKIFLSGNISKDITIKEKNKTYKIKISNGKTSELIETTVLQSNQEKFLNDLKKQSATLVKHDGLIKINHFKTYAKDKSAWYDINNDIIYSPYLKNEKYFDYSKISYLGKTDHLVYYFDSESGLVFEQNLALTGKENTVPLLQVEKNTEPYFNSQQSTLIYKTKNFDIPGVNKDWELTIARVGNTRHLLKVEINENSSRVLQPRLIEAILRVQRAYHISQPVKVTDSKNKLVGWFLNKSTEIETGRIVVASTKENNQLLGSEYAGYVKKKNGKFVFYFMHRDLDTNKLSLYQQDEGSNKNSKIDVGLFTKSTENILSISLVDHKPVILTEKNLMYTPNEEGEFLLTGMNFGKISENSTDLNSLVKNILSAHKKHLDVISIVDSSGSLAWYDFNKEIFILFDSVKKYLGTDNIDNYYFIDEVTNKIYYKNLKKGNIKNYSLENVNGKYKINAINNEDELSLLIDSTAYLNGNLSKSNTLKVNVAETDTIFEESFNNFEKNEREKALEHYNLLIQETSFKIEQDNLDASIPSNGTKRRSIIFVNDGWYNSSIEIVIEDKNKKMQNFHSWWGQKSNFTVTPLIPINTKRITVSIQSYFFGWSTPFFAKDFKLSDLPLCINSTGTLFNRGATVKNCNEKH